MRRRPLAEAGALALVLFTATATAGRAQEAPPAAGGPPLVKVTWQQALERAFKNNVSVIVAGQEIERASALVREARAAWLPTLSGNGNYVRLNTPNYFQGPVVNIWGANLALTVPIV